MIDLNASIPDLKGNPIKTKDGEVITIGEQIKRVLAFDAPEDKESTKEIKLFKAKLEYKIENSNGNINLDKTEREFIVDRMYKVVSKSTFSVICDFMINGFDPIAKLSE